MVRTGGEKLRHHAGGKQRQSEMSSFDARYGAFHWIHAKEKKFPADHHCMRSCGRRSFAKSLVSLLERDFRFGCAENLKFERS